MRRFGVALGLAALLTLGTALTALGHDASGTFVVGSTQVKVAGKDIPLEVPVHVFKDNQVWVPVRAVVEAWGGKVDWDGEKRQVHVSGPAGQHFILTVGSAEVNILSGGGSTPLSGPVHIVKDRAQVPLKFLAENFGYHYAFDDAANTATVTVEGH